MEKRDDPPCHQQEGQRPDLLASPGPPSAFAKKGAFGRVGRGEGERRKSKKKADDALRARQLRSMFLLIKP
jgi:hypothetical protein